MLVYENHTLIKEISGFVFLGCILIPFHYPKYALARSLLSQTVDKNEVGKIFSSLSLLRYLIFFLFSIFDDILIIIQSALVPFISHPMFGYIYDSSLTSFTGAFMLVTSLIIFIAMTLMIIIKYLMSKGTQLIGNYPFSIYFLDKLNQQSGFKEDFNHEMEVLMNDKNKEELKI